MTLPQPRTSFQTILAQHLDAANVHALPPGLDKWQAIDWLCARACPRAGVSRPDAVVEAVRERERILSTGIGFEVAVPHVRHADVAKETVVIGRPAEPLAFESVDGKPVRAVFLVLMPGGMHRRSIEVLGALASVLKPDANRESIFAAATSEEFVARLLRATARRDAAA